jgi:membrane fusion protein, heavy metal efflux system
MHHYHPSSSRISRTAMCRALSFLMLLLVAFAPSLSLAHGGDDHGDPKSTADAGVGPRMTAHSEAFEIVAIPTAKDGGKLRIYVSDLPSNAPLAKAQVEVTRGEATSKAKEVKGFYELDAPWVKTPGHYDLTYAVTVGDVSDLLIGTLDIPDAPLLARHDSILDHLLPQGSGGVIATWLSVLGGLGAILALSFAHSLAPELVRAGRISAAAVIAISLLFGAFGLLRGSTSVGPSANAILDQSDPARRSPDGSIFVPRPTQALLDVTTVRSQAAQTVQKTVRLVGQVIPDLNRSGLVQSLLSGRIEAPDGGFPSIGARVKKGEILGFLVPRVEFKDQSDILQTTGDLERQIALAESKLSRFERLKGVIAESQITDTRIELEGLRKRRATIRPLVPNREPLIAPVNGVVAQANVVSGQVVEAQALLFQIVDADNLWVEALAFDPVAAASIEKVSKEATARAADGREASLIFSGRGLTLKQQAVPLRFRIRVGSERFSIGEPVTVSAPIAEAISAIPLPRSAVVRTANGQSIVWVHTAPEKFEPRIISSEPIDADRIGVTAGLEPELRVVTRGAELINQIR